VSAFIFLTVSEYKVSAPVMCAAQWSLLLSSRSHLPNKKMFSFWTVCSLAATLCAILTPRHTILALHFAEPQSGVSLQRALATQRLRDLKAQRRQLKEQLATLSSVEEQEAEGAEGLEAADKCNGVIQSTTKRVSGDAEKGSGTGAMDSGKRRGGPEERAKKRVRFEEEDLKEARASKVDASMDAATGMLETVRGPLYFL
jgi:hypothetical protein